MSGVAICPGSYDPVTNGHIDVIKRAAAIFDRVVIGVVNEPRHKQPTFSLEERVAFADLGADYLDRVDKHRTAKRLVRRLGELGYEVMLRPKAAG